MPFCEGCDGHVTPDFVRVFGDRNGVVHACLECSIREEIRAGGHR